MTRAAFVYTRVSTIEQARDDATSLALQREKGEQYAALEGWEVAGVFEDAGVSGGKALSERPEGARMLAAIERGEAQAVIVYKVDRFTRSLADSQTLEKWKKRDIAFVSVQEKFNTSEPTGELMLDLLQVFAKFERKRITERNVEGRIAIVTDEKYQDEHGHVWRTVGQQLPYGYEADPITKRIGSHAEHADNVRRVYELRGRGLSTTKIAERMNAEGRSPRVRAGRVHPFSGDLARKILADSSTYRGHGFERLIDPESNLVATFAAPRLIEETAYEAALAGGRTVQQVPDAGTKTHDYALSQRIRHEHTDGTSSGMFGLAREVKGGTLRSYRCADARKSEHGPATCEGFGFVNKQNMTSVQADYAEAAALYHLLTLDDDGIAAMFRLDGPAAIDTAPLHERMTELQGQLARVLDFVKLAELSPTDAADQTKEIRGEIETIEERLAVAAREQARKSANVATLEAILTGEIVEPDTDHEGEPYSLDIEPLSKAQMIEEAGSVLAATPDAYGRVPFMDERAREALADIVSRLDVIVTVSRTEQARRPAVKVEACTP